MWKFAVIFYYTMLRRGRKNGCINTRLGRETGLPGEESQDYELKARAKRTRRPAGWIGQRWFALITGPGR